MTTTHQWCSSKYLSSHLHSIFRVFVWAKHQSETTSCMRVPCWNRLKEWQDTRRWLHPIWKKSINMNIFPKWGENKGCLKLQLEKSYQYSLCMGMGRKTNHIYPCHYHVSCIIITIPNAEKSTLYYGKLQHITTLACAFTREQVKWSKHGHKLPHQTANLNGIHLLRGLFPASTP